MEIIPYGRQSISENDIQSVVAVLRSDYLTQGAVVPQFEQAVAEYVGARYAVAVNSGTSALHIACLALGLGQGDYLWTSAITFVASANCGLYCGAQVDFVDINADTLTMSVEALEQKLEYAKKEGVLPKVIIPVHFAGQSCDMQAIYALSLRYGFYIIEDACHAIGGRYLDKPIGGCQYSDMSVFSFHPVKIITTAEGGMVVTHNKHWADKMTRLRSHGITREPELMIGQPDGQWVYQQLELGFNYRMTELQAALGVSQLQRMDDFIAQRHVLQQRYDDLLQDCPVITPLQSEQSYSALHLYPIQLKPEKLTKTRLQVFDELRERGIGVNVHYIPVHTQPYYQQLGFRIGDFPVAEQYYQYALSLPLYADLSLAQQDKVVSALSSVLLRT